MSSNYTLYRPVSTSIKCIICGQDLIACGCNKASITSGANACSAYYTANGGLSSGGITTTGTFWVNCQTCGQPIGTCACGTAAPLINPNPNYINVPAIMPTYPAGTGTWTGLVLNTDTIYGYLKVLDVEDKKRYDHSGVFRAERKNETDGIYGNLSGLILPILFKETFALIRKEESFKLWQIRSPLVFQIDFQIDANKEESHYFTMVSVKDVEIGEEKLILTDPRFQEVPNPIDLCQLIEIQRVFTKLLRRI